MENIWKARSIWERFSRILGQEGSYPRTYGTFYKAVVQEILLFGLETWVMKPRIGRTLGGFQHRVAHSMSGMQPARYMSVR